MFIYGTIIAIFLSLLIFIFSFIFNISMLTILAPIIIWIVFLIITFLIFKIFNCKLEKKNCIHKEIFKVEDPTYFQ